MKFCAFIDFLINIKIRKSTNTKKLTNFYTQQCDKLCIKVYYGHNSKYAIGECFKKCWCYNSKLFGLEIRGD